MSNTNGQTPAGWYPDPSGSQQSRWWDGGRWTEHVQPAAYSQPYGQAAYASAAPAGGASFVPARPLLTQETPVYNVFIWVVVFIPLLSSLTLLFWNPVAGLSQLRSSRDIHLLTAPMMQFFWGEIVISLVGFVAYGLMVVFSWLDYRRLESVGVTRPFHWAWAFLSPLVYVIGRSIIVHQVAPRRGLAPIWASIGVLVVGFIVAIVWSSLLFSGMMHVIPSPGVYGGGSGV